MVLVQPGGDRKIVHVGEPKWSRGHMVLVRAGGNQCVKKIVREPKWSRSSPSLMVLESEDGTISEESKAKEKESDRYSHNTSLTS